MCTPFISDENVEFNTNGSMDVEIPIAFNEVLEGDRIVTVSLETEDRAVMLSNSSVNVTITDASE